MCEYCDLSNYKKKWFDDDEKYLEYSSGNWMRVELCYDERRKKYSIEVTGDGAASIDLDFCPFCGRKLVEDEEDREDYIY